VSGEKKAAKSELDVTIVLDAHFYAPNPSQQHNEADTTLRGTAKIEKGSN